MHFDFGSLHFLVNSAGGAMVVSTPKTKQAAAAPKSKSRTPAKTPPSSTAKKSATKDASTKSKTVTATGTPKARAGRKNPAEDAKTPSEKKPRSTATPKAVKSAVKKAPKESAPPTSSSTPKSKDALKASTSAAKPRARSSTPKNSKKLAASLEKDAADKPMGRNGAAVTSLPSEVRKVEAKGNASKCALLVPLCLLFLEFFCRLVLDVPLAKVARNVFLPPTPAPVHGKYECPHLQDNANASGGPSYVGGLVTVVVTVKDACSQAPGFIEALHSQLPRDTHVIYTYPNISTCANVPGLREALTSGPQGKWDKVTVLPLPLSVSPMTGWVDAADFVATKYALLLHNDGYALDPFFTCELLGALETRDQDADAAAGGPFVVAAPMLYESKADKSLAAHATQSNLRLVEDASASTGRIVRHDHSVSRALNRGSDFGEGEQSEFLEDHGFLIETNKIKSVIDPMASYTLEYIDMIMSIRSNKWRVLFVPTARLEFRITEFSWRDIPYFMYKRSEATCHGTRDYLTAKWKANFPNTGFWTYIKYTIVEQHVYGPNELAKLSWHETAAVAFGFFQMAGFNRYEDHVGGSGTVPFTSVLTSLDDGWYPQGPLLASRELQRPPYGLAAGATIKDVKPTKQPIEAILGPARKPSTVSIEADMPLEYLPFAVAELRFPTSAAVPPSVLPLCGLLVEHAGSSQGGVGFQRSAGEVTCWVNLPTFKSNGRAVQMLNALAALVKLPSRVTTYLEMAQGSTRTAAKHLEVLAGHFNGYVAGRGNRLHACEASQANCQLTFEFGRKDQVLQFSGKPPSAWELDKALEAVLEGLK